MKILISFVILAAGIVLLAKGADYTVDGAEGLALKLGISPMTIGLTVIAFGTSLPELVVSGEAFFSGFSEIGIGNIVGSCIANIGLVFALTVLIRPNLIIKERGPELRYSMLMLLATLTYILLAARGILDLASGLVFLAVFGIVLASFWRSGYDEDCPQGKTGNYPLLLTIAGLAMIIIGSHLLLTAAVELAGMFGIPPFVIGFTMVAVGTSFPELVTSIVAGLKGSPGISIGNLLGSNIFNLLFIPGVCSLFVPIPIPLASGSLVLLAFSLAVIPPLLMDEKKGRIWAAALIIAYLAYMAVLLGTA
ncbi:MAG TPA: sodium:calcium antiporter [Methanoregulaceae archaeon]|nr:sodium:calcium antiporter [Methanoregulaceae archaeon]MDD5048349.1 sodium:calcium antiporter [Methanoregulaceae archaeon]MDD5684249.1 sodium:calcium antiporter [Methanoregulaceae archaeon]HOP67037.1 sodium:calcium antiporter [Methanoregulaceae archaeon]HPJ73242.1 sodium:calcium antiporter [Methanoregulaceae archaeon]